MFVPYRVEINNGAVKLNMVDIHLNLKRAYP